MQKTRGSGTGGKSCESPQCFRKRAEYFCTQCLRGEFPFRLNVKKATRLNSWDGDGKGCVFGQWPPLDVHCL